MCLTDDEELGVCMSPGDFEKLIRDFFERQCVGLMLGPKDKEYAREGDKLHNFKKAGRRRGKSSEEALMGMLEKHLTSIDDMAQDLEKRFQNKEMMKPDLDKWREKIGDAINYFFLLWGLLNDK